MSTKIYNGITLPNINILADLDRFWRKAREILLPILRNEYKKQFLWHMAIIGLTISNPNARQWARFNYPYLMKNCKDAWLDDLAFNPDPNKIRFHVDEALRLQARKNQVAESFSEYVTPLDFEAKLGVYPVNGKILGLPFINNSAMKKAFMEMTGVVPYPYWDCTDKDKAVSVEEWAQRKRDWDIALPGIGVPRESGMTFKITGYQDARCNYYDFSDISVDEILLSPLKEWAGCELLNMAQEQWKVEHPDQKVGLKEILQIRDIVISEDGYEQKRHELVDTEYSTVKEILNI